MKKKKPLISDLLVILTAVVLLTYWSGFTVTQLPALGVFRPTLLDGSFFAAGILIGTRYPV